jgi:branched-chain amino acid transport system permease protein
MGFSINVLTMFGMVLVIGIVVDDAIVVVENVERIMSEEGLPPLQATRKAMGQISGAIIGVTVVLVAFQYWFFEHTLLGKKLQATSQDKEMASLLGIPVATMIMVTFVYSAMIGGLAGILVAPILFVSIHMGGTIALKAFAATIIGGFGDVAGAIIGGLALGVIETFGAAYVSVPYKDGFAFLVLVAFLVFRPQGIFGERVAEKA